MQKFLSVSTCQHQAWSWQLDYYVIYTDYSLAALRYTAQSCNC